MKAMLAARSAPGVCWMSSSLTVTGGLDASVFTASASAVTATLVSILASLIENFNTGALRIVTFTTWLPVAKPSCWISMVYESAGTALIVNAPATSVCACFVNAEVCAFNVTFASGIEAPCGSTTVQRTVPKICAYPITALSNRKNPQINNLRNNVLTSCHGDKSSSDPECLWQPASQTKTYGYGSFD